MLSPDFLICPGDAHDLRGLGVVAAPRLEKWTKLDPRAAFRVVNIDTAAMADYGRGWRYAPVSDVSVSPDTKWTALAVAPPGSNNVSSGVYIVPTAARVRAADQAQGTATPANCTRRSRTAAPLRLRRERDQDGTNPGTPLCNGLSRADGSPFGVPLGFHLHGAFLRSSVGRRQCVDFDIGPPLPLSLLVRAQDREHRRIPAPIPGPARLCSGGGPEGCGSWTGPVRWAGRRWQRWG